jgi:hypothetical protein
MTTFEKGFVVALLTFLLPAALIRCTPPGASDAQRVKNAVDLAGYTDALDRCRAQGKAARSYPIYEECARAADRKYGYDGGAP